ncbi:hypothetical protein [Leptospira koniambonensis]|uniref:hypothetical protein n=1 Tax=Leptospira koniambonensis TaxID=2484950 RepID=UPI003EBDCBB6
MKLCKIAALILVLGFSSCKEDKKDDLTSFLFPIFPNLDTNFGTNLAQVSFDTFNLDNAITTSCDSDNSSGQGIVVDLSSVFPSGYYIKIDIVPSTSPFLFPENGNLDLHLGSEHRPSDPPTCTLTRTSNSFLKYAASLSNNCEVMNHTFTRLEIDCIPN